MKINFSVLFLCLFVICEMASLPPRFRNQLRRTSRSLMCRSADNSVNSVDPGIVPVGFRVHNELGGPGGAGDAFVPGDGTVPSGAGGRRSGELPSREGVDNPRNVLPDDDIRPIDSISNVPSRKTASTTLSKLKYQAIQKEIELKNQLMTLTERNKFEDERKELESRLEFEKVEEEIRLASEKAERLRREHELKARLTEINRKEEELLLRSKLSSAAEVNRMYVQVDSEISFKRPVQPLNNTGPVNNVVNICDPVTPAVSMRDPVTPAVNAVSMRDPVTPAVYSNNSLNIHEPMIVQPPIVNINNRVNSPINISEKEHVDVNRDTETINHSMTKSEHVVHGQQ
ncbi:uncharacterized protein LOC130012375 [Patella vulgata]|uniref:uncharacterized protein LOC130012375 n=1 Tax=Patella vulgata TaxID=6465 RepID=UPI0024A89BF3|nr:uncharacterized protein LOC130012375 [Patella vulgata]